MSQHFSIKNHELTKATTAWLQRKGRLFPKISHRERTKSPPGGEGRRNRETIKRTSF